MERQGYARSLLGWLEWTGFDANGTRASGTVMALLKSSSLFLNISFYYMKASTIYSPLSNAHKVSLVAMTWYLCSIQQSIKISDNSLKWHGKQSVWVCPQAMSILLNYWWNSIWIYKTQNISSNNVLDYECHTVKPMGWYSAMFPLKGPTLLYIVLYFIQESKNLEILKMYQLLK